MWLVKQEPSAYSWDDFVRDGKTAWTGVRNFQARNNLQAMKQGDRVLFYHSVTGKAVVGVAEVIRAAYPDPTDRTDPTDPTDRGWICVDLAPIRALERPVTLAEIKAEPALANIGLLRQSRLSVMALSPQEYETILALAKKR